MLFDSDSEIIPSHGNEYIDKNSISNNTRAEHASGKCEFFWDIRAKSSDRIWRSALCELKEKYVFLDLQGRYFQSSDLRDVIGRDGHLDQSRAPDLGHLFGGYRWTRSTVWSESSYLFKPIYSSGFLMEFYIVLLSAHHSQRGKLFITFKALKYFCINHEHQSIWHHHKLNVLVRSFWFIWIPMWWV